MITFIFVVFMIAIYLLAFKGYKRVDSAEDLIIANWNLPLPLVTWSLTAALLAAPFYFAAVDSGYFLGGWESFATMGGLGTAMIICAFTWVKPLRRLKGWTIADYYGIRFADKKLGAYAGIIMIVAFGFFNAGALTVGGAYIIQVIFDIPFWASAIVFVILTIVYTLMGGLWSLAYADVLNGIISVLGILTVTLVIIFTNQGEIFNPNWWDVNRLFDQSGADFWILYLVLALGNLAAADLGQRVAGAKSPSIASKSMIIAGLIVLIVGWTPGIIGEAFKMLYPGVENAESLLLLYPLDYWHPIFAGLFLTAMVGMAMSTLAACYMAAVGVFAKNIYLDFINKKPSQKKLLFYSRVAILVCGVVALYISISFEQVLAVAYLAWDIIFATLFWPLLLPPFWKGVSSKAVWSSISAGLFVYVVTLFAGVPLPGEGGLLWTLLQEPVFFAVVISGIIIVVVSKLSPPNQATLDAHARELDKTADELPTEETFGGDKWVN
ncbi:sodium:solute symporter family protein [Salirhabdus salicampi]|uniref:sodium:solute symporter family protein n=1 Tax=Salirhabdus salicampi TaxID=476102 RepID=UPI0020C42F37|nr:sodium:solute symporter family protein [Salirhabdus salicampi]MCP8615267.1 sodium:solute symporter family protein [Salirhabdus salicampi]